MREEQWRAPHLFIGIGGTGTKAVTCIAEKIAPMIRKAGEVDATEGIPGCLRLLAIDADQNEFTARVP